jgi:hypothetical protein
MALILRKTEDGVRVDGDAPEEHVFSARHIERELAEGLIEVFVHLNTTDGPHIYKLQGFEPNPENEDGEVTANLSAWVTTKQED